MRETLTKLREPSTWAGLGLLVSLAAPSLPGDVLPAIGNAGQALAGLALIVMREAAKR